MGEESTRIAGKPAEPPIRNPEPAAGGKPAGGKTAGGKPAAGNPSPQTAGDIRTGTGGTGRTAEKEKARTGVVLLKEETAPIPETPKKKQTRKPRKKKEITAGFNAEQISALIVSMSAIVASRDGFEMFALSKVEANQLANPIANMIAKSEKIGALAEHADAVALITASIVIFAPRIMMCLDAKKEKAKRKKEGIKFVREEKPADAGSGNTARSNADNAKNVNHGISAAIPAIM